MAVKNVLLHRNLVVDGVIVDVSAEIMFVSAVIPTCEDSPYIELSIYCVCTLPRYQTRLLFVCYPPPLNNHGQVVASIFEGWVSGQQLEYNVPKCLESVLKITCTRLRSEYRFD